MQKYAAVVQDFKAGAFQNVRDGCERLIAFVVIVAIDGEFAERRFD